MRSGPAVPAPIVFHPFSGAPKPVGALGPLSLAGSGFALSPDRRYLLYAQVDQAGSDILLLEHYR